MDQPTTLQPLEYLETGFEVSKIMAHAGYRMDAPAFVITWGQVAETLAHALADHGLTPDRLDEEQLLDLAQAARKVLVDDKMLSWRDSLRMGFATVPGIADLLEPDLAVGPMPDIEDDEGPLTELYENATRLGDDESYWVDGGASADLFDDF
jgi:hypothetical protein